MSLDPRLVMGNDEMLLTKHHFKHHYRASKVDDCRSGEDEMFLALGHDSIRIKLSINKRRSMTRLRHRHGFFSSRIISLAIIFYFMISINQSFITTLINSNNSFSTKQETKLKSNNILQASSANQGSIHQQLDPFIERSLITLASALPAPEPASPSARSVTHRVPPINGSIFGKRSLDNQAKYPSRPNKSTKYVKSEIFAAKIEQSEAERYPDLITELIESFMAKNQDEDPKEASVAFCRMIVYECNQFMKHHSTKR